MTGSLPLSPDFRESPAIIGMIHLHPTPGSPGFLGLEESLERALSDADRLLEAGFDGLLVENMHDFPTLREKDMGPEVAAYIAVISKSLRDRTPPEIPIGIQVLFAAHRTATAVALAAGLQFLRVEAWTYGHLSDKGWVEASAATTLRYAHAIGAKKLRIWADVKKKHASHAASADLSAGEISETLELHGAHAAIITGLSTGQAPDPAEFKALRAHCRLPLVLGSGLTVQNASPFREVADAFIVGSSIKQDAKWMEPVDLDRSKRLVEAIRG